jgi:Caspase domain
MSRLKSSLLCVALLAGLLGFANHRTFAQATTDTIPHPPPSALAQVQPAVANTEDSAQTAPQGAEQRVALVIGNSNYQNAAQLANPGNDAQSMGEFLSSAGFEVISATNLTQNDMIRVVQDFSAKVAARGPNTVAMVYYAGHGVQLEGENYLIPIDAKVASPRELVGDSLRLVDVMATLEAIPSRVRIVMLDACRNNPFPSVVDAGRGLAIVDAPNGSIVGYSTAPGTEAQDGNGGHSPYASAFLRLAHERNLPIEQLFKRIRLEVNHVTEGVQTPWESSSLTSEFYFFGDTAIAATRAPEHGTVMQMASNLPMRSVRQAYDYVLSEGSPAYYQEFIQMFPRDPLCERIRFLLGHLLQAAAWHEAVLENSPLAYKSFYDKYSSSPYALSALKLQSQPKIMPLLQPTHLIVPQQLEPTLKFSGTPKYNLNVRTVGPLGPGHAPVPGNNPTTKIVTLPAQGNATPNAGKIVPGETVGKAVSTADLKGDRLVGKGDRLPNRVIEHPIETRRQSRIETRDTGVHKFKGPGPMRAPRQTGFVPGRMGGMRGGGFGSHFAMGGGGHGGFGRR